MKLRDPNLLAAYMADRDFTQARLGRYAERSRQFVHMLLTGQRNTCQEEVARRIEEALAVLPGTLFEPKESPDTRQKVARRRSAA